MGSVGFEERGKMEVERLGSRTFALGANKKEREREEDEHDSIVLLEGVCISLSKVNTG